MSSKQKPEKDKAFSAKREEAKAPSAKREEAKALSAKREEAKAPAGPSKIQSFFSYFELSKKELSKISWPTKKEVKGTTFAVLALVCVMSVFLGLVDLILSGLIQKILSMSI